MDTNSVDTQTTRFVLNGQIPSGKNRIMITRTGHRFPDKRFTAWRADALEQVQTQATPFHELAEVKMKVLYTPGDRVRRDVTGMMDALFHVIEKALIVSDDARIKDVRWTTLPVKPHKSKCVVELQFLRMSQVSKKKKKKIGEQHTERLKFSEI